MKIYFKEKGKGFVCLTDHQVHDQLLGTDTSYVDNTPLSDSKLKEERKESI